MRKALAISIHLTLIALCTSHIAEARLSESPDDNTLWVEDGDEIQFGPTNAASQWQTQLQMTPSPGGGFVIHPSDEENGVVRYVKADPAYPYLVWQISDITPPSENYRQFTMAYDGISLFQMVTQIQEGIFVVPLRTENPKPLLQIYIYNIEFKFNFIKLVQEPEYNIVLSSTAIQERGKLELGDELTFRVVLPSPAEDVTLNFFHSNGMKPISLNGEPELPLQPEGNNKNVWVGSIKIDSCKEGNTNDQTYPPGTFVVKATILGGQTQVPLWTANSNEFQFGSSEK